MLFECIDKGIAVRDRCSGSEENLCLEIAMSLIIHNEFVFQLRILLRIIIIQVIY